MIARHVSPYVGCPEPECTLRNHFEDAVCRYCGEAIERWPGSGRWSSDKHGDVCFSPEAHPLWRVHVDA